MLSRSRPTIRACRSIKNCAVSGPWYPRMYSNGTTEAVLECMLPKGTFNGKRAFITGGGTGLGKDLAKNLSLLGAKVVIASRKLEVLQKTAEELTQETGNEVVPVCVDVRDAGAVSKAAEFCVECCGGLPHMIVNNAAGNFISPFERLSPNAWKTIVDIVLNGSALVTMEFGKRLIKAKQSANFLSITTNYARCGSAYVVPSAAAKAGVEVMVKSLASEWGKYGFRFNAIAPGPIQTKGAFDRLDPMGKFADHMLSTIPLARMGEKQELSNLSAYLLSDYSSWCNGVVIDFDGGQLPFMSGMFNPLVKQVSEEDWDKLEEVVRKVKGS